jgi:undecaprenyl-diphosphatase
MTDIFDRVGELLTSLGTWGYVIVAVVVFFETVIAIGQFLPGSVFLAFVGFLCFVQIFDIETIAAIVFVAHYLGEISNYVIGWKKGRRLFTEDALIFRRNLLDAVENQLRRWGPFYFVLCQFSGVLRPILSFLAGAVRYSPARFALWMVPACAIWTAVHLGVGFILGAGWREAANYVEEFSLLLAVSLVSVAIAIWLSRTLVALAGFAGQAIERLGRRVVASPAYQQCRQFNPTIFHFIERRLSLSSQWGWRATVRFLGTGVLWIVALLLGLFATRTHRLAYFDSALVNFLAQVRRPAIAIFLAKLTSLGEPRAILWTSIVLATVCSAFRMRRSALLLAGSPALGLAIGWGIKWLLQRPRPENAFFLPTTGFSFPSNHCAVVSAFFTATCVWAWRNTENRQLRVAWGALAITIIFLVSYSRVYLGVHYLTDVLGGCLLGLGSALAMATISSRVQWREERRSLATMILAAAALLSMSVWAGFRSVPPSSQQLDTVRPSCKQSFTSLTQSLAGLPRYATRLTGRRSVPIDMVVIGEAADLANRLERQGWRIVRPQAFYTREIQAPIFPAFVEAHPAVYTLEKRKAQIRLILRFWPTKICIGSQRIWVGSLIQERLRKRLFTMEIFAVDPDIDRALEDWCSEITACPCKLLNGFRERGLYRASHPFFTHGLVAVVDVTNCDTSTSETQRYRNE